MGTPSWQKVLAWFKVCASQQRINLLNFIPQAGKKEEVLSAAVQMQNEIKFPVMVTYWVSVISFHDTT